LFDWMKDYWGTVINWLARVRSYGLRNAYRLKKNLRKDNLFSLNINHHKFFLRGGTVDFAVMDSILRKGEYDLDTGFNPEIIVDAGANIGASTLYFRIRYPEARIYAIEPERSNFELLQKNLSDYPGVTMENCAIWSENRELIISNPGAEKYAFQMAEARENADIIPGVTVDSLIDRWQLPHIDLLKMDVEGAEKLIFDMPEIRWLEKVRVLIVELHESLMPGTVEVFQNALRGIEYESYQRGENHVIINRGFKIE
jgi:FkbM family methyltransferase